MRYLGNKSKILPYIEDVIEKYQIEGKTFADIFAALQRQRLRFW